MKATKVLRVFLASAGLMLWWGAVGCNAPWLRDWQRPSYLEADYGRSVSNNIAQQIVHPPGGRVTGPPVGLSPQASQNVIQGYNDSFVKKKEEKTKPIVVDIAK